MFFNPFPWWFIAFVIIPFRLLSFITYLPYYFLSCLGLGKWYGRGHFIVFAHLEQFTLDPKNYCQHFKAIHKQTVEDSKLFK